VHNDNSELAAATIEQCGIELEARPERMLNSIQCAPVWRGIFSTYMVEGYHEAGLFWRQGN
jgi:hypothetical protein